MPTFHLEPKDGQTTDPRWQATSLREACWINAPSPHIARLRVEVATVRFLDHDTYKVELFSPWIDADLTDCSPGNAPGDLPDGIILTASGKRIS
jgi:hypothetical protein